MQNRPTASWLLIAIFLGLALSVGGVPASAQESQRTNTVVVKLRDGTWVSRTLSGPNHDLEAMRANDPDIVEVGRPLVYEQFVSSTPSDPGYGLQWHLKRTQAARSWQHGDGSGVVVAVLDSGVDPVSDLECHDYVSPADMVFGLPGVPGDLNGHGTIVTQVVAECTDNSSLGAGTAPGTSIMPVRVLDSAGSTTSYEIFNGLMWALDHGADVVNLSLGFACAARYPTCIDPIIDFAIAELVANDVIVVAASGNDGGPFVSYPANHPDTVAVGATGFDGRRASYSTGGAGLWISAPTGDENDPSGKDGVIHQGASGSLELAAGTSFSAPQVTGAVAMLLSGGASPNGALTAILQTAADVSPSGYDTGTGYGELRIRDAQAWGGIGLTPPIADARLHFQGDADGNGRSDLITYDGAFGRWWVLSSSGTEFDAAQWTRYSTTGGWSAHRSGDFTGDGRVDLASFHPSNGTWWVSPSTGSSFGTTLWADFSTASGWGPQLVGDFNGDGRDDIANYAASNGTWWISRSTGSGFSTALWADFSTATGWKTHMVGDFNGDGRDDIASYHPSNGTWWISRSTGSGFATSLWADFASASGWSVHTVGDFDGDGLHDIANFHPSNGTWWISRSTGSSFGTTLWADFSTASGWGPQLVGDFNGDGRDDIANYAASNGTWWVSRSTGDFLTTSLWADYSTASGYTARLVGDFDGDGRDDLANHHRTGVWIVSRAKPAGGFSTATWFD